MSWISLLDIMYPVGSLYFSTSSTSPATLVGGSWTQIKGATIAAVGSNGVTLNSYSGNLKITLDQIPNHEHNVLFGSDDFAEATGAGKQNSSTFYGYNTKNTRISIYSGVGTIDGWGARRLYALQLWSLYLVSNQLVGGYNG